jgi:hypothetical protein
MIRTRFIVLLFLPLVALSSAPLEAQEIFASLTGTVTDPQGAALPGVTVTAVNVDTRASSQAVTDSRGGYTIAKLPPGHYRMTAALQGFNTFVREGIVLRTAETGMVYVRMALGTVSEAITVSATLSAVESNETTLAQTMDNKRVSELPLNGRQVYMLLQLTPGTIFTQTTFGATGFSGTRAWDVNGSITIHGSRTGNNEFLIDGAATSGTGGWSYAPPVDAIEEFKVQTASTDASYGRTSGGVVNLTLKAGTNAYKFSNTLMYRGTSLDSKTIQNINTGTTINGHKYYDAEGMLSGPIRRDKTFFMGGVSGLLREHSVPQYRHRADRSAARRGFPWNPQWRGPTDHHLRPADHSSRSRPAGPLHPRSDLVQWRGQRDLSRAHESRGCGATSVHPASKYSRDHHRAE